MKIKVDLIVFDLDGTLAATVPDIAQAANRACRRLGLAEHPEAAIQQMIGGGEKNFIRRLIGPEQEDRFDEALALYLDYYSHHLVDKTRLYPGVEETLAALSGKKLAVLSNKLERLTRGIVERLGLASFFAAVKGGDSYGALKPASQGLAALIQELGESPGFTLMVGDKPGDVLSGRGAGAHTVAVTYGWRDRGAQGRSPGSHDRFLQRFERVPDLNTESQSKGHILRGVIYHARHEGAINCAPTRKRFFSCSRRLYCQKLLHIKSVA